MSQLANGQVDLSLDGTAAEQLFTRGTSYTYDDLLLLPDYIDFPSSKVKLDTRITQNIALKAPLVSSCMDTVTEGKMAIALALLGGTGILHYSGIGPPARKRFPF